MAEPSNVDATMMLARYPALSAYWSDSALLALTISDAEDDCSAAQFGALRDRSIAALVAHRLILRGDEAAGDLGAAFVVSKAAAGGVSADYVTLPPEGTQPASMHYYTTKPGVEYMELAKRVGGGFYLV
jgi:hypothetical protein